MAKETIWLEWGEFIVNGDMVLNISQIQEHEDQTTNLYHLALNNRL